MRKLTADRLRKERTFTSSKIGSYKMEEARFQMGVQVIAIPLAPPSLDILDANPGGLTRLLELRARCGSQ